MRSLHPPRRSGFSALLLVLGAALLLMAWAGAQRFTHTSIRRRVQIAEAGRRALLLATTAVDEGIDAVIADANEPPTEAPEADENDPASSLADQLRQLAPGDVLEFAYEPRLAAGQDGGVPLEVSQVWVRAYLLGIDPGNGPPPGGFPCREYRSFLLKWNRVPG